MNITVSIPGEYKEDALEQAQQNKTIALHVASELNDILAKCQKLVGPENAIDELKLSGLSEIETIEVIYNENDGKTTLFIKNKI